MNQLNGKTIILWIMALILCVTACWPAFASAGDRVIFRSKTGDDGMSEDWIDSVWKAGDGIYVVIRGNDDTVLAYRDLQSEPERFTMKRWGFANEDSEAAESAIGETAAVQALPVLGIGDEDNEDEGDEDEDDEDDNSFLVAKTAPEEENGEKEPEQSTPMDFYVENWFVWNNELYGIGAVQTSTEKGNRVDSIAIRRAKLEDGKIILEDSGLPELDREHVVESYDESENFTGIYNLFTAGNYLIGISYGMTQKLVAFNLTDGSSKAMELDYESSIEAARNDDHSFLLCRGKWTGDYSTADVTVSRVNPEDLSEEPLTELKGLKDTRISPCYDGEKNTLYYVAGGQLWAMPELDQSKAEAVNECPEQSPNTILLPDGYVLIWSNRTVMIKNTDPSQRADITLRVFDNWNTDAMNEAIFEMGNQRRDISVILQQEWSSGSNDILQAMMNRDGQTDIYIMQYNGNDFRALRNRGYLTDLSDNAQIAAETERMYPWIQNAMKQDGKIIAVPVGFYSETYNINMSAWKEIGGTEEELPRTWEQFFDWIETLPKRLEGTEYTAVEQYMSRTGFRMSAASVILAEYQAVMDSKGEDYAFNTPLLAGLLKRLENLDYETLGLPEEVNYEEADDGGDDWHTPMVSNYGYSGITGYDDGYVPLVLSFSEEEPAMLPVTMYAAFVNPYSEHQQEAKELLALMLKKMDIYSQYKLFTDKTEPIQIPDMDEMVKNHEKTMEEYRKKLEKADDAEKPMLEEWIQSEEKYWNDKDRWMWTISPNVIATYQKLSSVLIAQDSAVIDELWGTEEKKERDQIFKGLFGYEDPESQDKPGNVAIEEALDMIDRKIQMKRKEGN